VRARRVLLAAFFLLLVGILGFNGWLLAKGRDVQAYTVGLITSITVETQIAIAFALLKLALAVAGLTVAARLLRRLLASAEGAVNRWDQLKSNNESLSRLFRGLDRLIVTTAWMLLGVLACGWFGLPQSFGDTLRVAARVYLIVAIGFRVIRCTAVIVDTLDGFSRRSAQKHGWVGYYNQLHPLIPTFRTCLEYALWIAVASLVLAQIHSFRHLASWGPRLVQAIGIFFAGRVLIELGSLEIGHRMLPAKGLSETDRRRRATVVPLVRTAFTYATYFGTAALMLSALGSTPCPSSPGRASWASSSVSARSRSSTMSFPASSSSWKTCTWWAT
jgi:small conductance mechanosensitive channel